MTRTAKLYKASERVPKKITWLWENWLAEGMVHILAGKPGVGKSTIALTVAAIVSRGGTWPDGTQSPVGDVAIWSGEDDIDTTILPRLIKAGANLARIHFVTGVYERDGKETPNFEPARDIDALRESIGDMPNIKLVIFDPIAFAVANDTHKEGDVRRGLKPLVDLAEERGVAVLGIGHFSKNTAGRDPLARVTGSYAFGAQARIVWAATKNEETKQHVLFRVKSNVGIDSGGWRYDLSYGPIKTDPDFSVLSIVWRDKITMSGLDILAEVDNAIEKAGALSEAKAFLLDILADGPMPQRVIEEKAKAEGISRQTLRRAKDSLGVKSVKEGFDKGGRWKWTLHQMSKPKGKR